MKKCFTSLFFFLFTSLVFDITAQIYVNDDAAGMNNGTSWADAYTDLQMALANASEGDEIRVAQGTYLPGTDSTSTFLIDQNIQLLGGYDAETGDRDPEMYVTILSGDPNQNDMDDDFVTYRDDNLWTVVTIHTTITNATLIDGFSIRGGHADVFGSAGKPRGGGIYSVGAPTIRNCVFEQNFARRSGGGLYLGGSASQGAFIENCRFEINRADTMFFDHGGGGLNVEDVSGEGITINQCEFIENEGS